MARPTSNILLSEDGPEFFKVFMPSYNAKNMRIPQVFVRNFFQNSPKKATLKNEAGDSWPLSIEKIEDKLYFTAGWERFVRDNSLMLGDFLMFKLASTSSFGVKIYERNGCKRSTKAKSGLAEEEREDKSEIRHGVENMKRKSSSTPQNIASEKVWEKRARAESTTNPISFVMTCTASKNSKYNVFIPRRLVHGIRIKKENVLRCKNNKLWPVTVRIRNDVQVVITTGWARFVGENRLKPGDKCLFKLLVDKTNKCREITVNVNPGDA